MSFFKHFDPRKLGKNIKRTAQKVIKKGKKAPNQLQKIPKKIESVPDELRDQVEECVKDIAKVASKDLWKKCLEGYLKILKMVRPDTAKFGLSISAVSIAFAFNLTDERFKFIESLKNDPPDGKDDIIRILRALGPDTVEVGASAEVEVFVSFLSVGVSGAVEWDTEKLIERLKKGEIL